MLQLSGCCWWLSLLFLSLPASAKAPYALSRHHQGSSSATCTTAAAIIGCCCVFRWVTGELSTLCQVAKVPNEPNLRQNNGSETMCPSDQSMASVPQTGQAERFGAMTTSRGSKAGHVMTQMCQPSKAGKMARASIRVPKHMILGNWQCAVAG